MSGSTTIVRSGFLAALVLAAVPGQALAQGGYYGPFGPPQEDYGPGVTVSGAGLARVKAPSQLNDDSIRQAVSAARAKAISRAVADARQRAEAVATATGISLGSARRGGAQPRLPGTPAVPPLAAHEGASLRRAVVHVLIGHGDL